MSSATTIDQKMPKPISRRLRELRGKLSQFLIVDGLGRVLAVLVLLVLVDVLIDRFFKMDFSQRAIMLTVMTAIILAVVFFRLMRPIFRRPSDDALILQVEGHNKQLRESVISSVQFSRGTDVERQGISPEMVHATIRHGAEMAQGLDFRNAINRAAHSRNLVLLLATAIGVGAISWGVANSNFWNLWFKRNILLTNDQWPKSTHLEIVGIEGNQITLPRGEDHQQFVVVSEHSKIKQVDVSIEFDDGNSRSHQKMRRTGKLNGRQHLLVFRNLSNEFRFRASGGDDVTDWVQVRLVEPPGWAQLEMIVQLPEYTGVGNQPLPHGSGPHSVLEGSSLKILASANKPLSEANLKLGDQSWPMLKDEDENYRLHIDSDQLAGGKYAFDLADQSGLRSSRPTKFTLKIKPDREPDVRAALLGISGQVVPRVRIPVSFIATDEYAITKLEFTHWWKADASGSVPQQGSIDLGQVDGQVGGPEIRSVQVLDLEPFQVPIGVGLRIAVAATDNNTLTGPSIGKSREFLLRVVSEEELREDLLRREIEQRKAFELAMKNQEELTVDVKALTAVLTDTEQSADSEQMQENLLSWQRQQKQIGTNISTIADRFEEFLVEVKNNRLDEAESELQNAQSMEMRFNQQIIEPIRQLDQTEIIIAAQQLETSQRSVGNRGPLIDHLRTAATTQDQIIEAMQRILTAMQDSETYQEVVNKVIEVKRSEEKVRDLTRDRRQQSGIEDIFDNDDLFDKKTDEDRQQEKDQEKKDQENSKKNRSGKKDGDG